MSANWAEVNEKRISEKTQEILLYCNQKASLMTSRAFELARISFSQLIDNLVQRNIKLTGIAKAIKQSMESQNSCIAICSEQKADLMAKTIVYDYVGNDLNLYPVSAKQKLQRSQARKEQLCVIPLEEMTFKDCLFVIYSSLYNNSIQFSRETINSAYTVLEQKGLSRLQANIYAFLCVKGTRIRLIEIPNYSILSTDYRLAAKGLLENGVINEVEPGFFSLAEKTLM